jgi:hypothetical protein
VFVEVAAKIAEDDRFWAALDGSDVPGVVPAEVPKEVLAADAEEDVLYKSRCRPTVAFDRVTASK